MIALLQYLEITKLGIKSGQNDVWKNRYLPLRRTAQTGINYLPFPFNGLNQPLYVIGKDWVWAGLAVTQILYQRFTDVQFLYLLAVGRNGDRGHSA